MSKHIYVNGPLNVVRLQNNKINKVLYLMFDAHLEPEDQLRCESKYAEDVATFLLNTFDELKITSNKTYDFMLEIERTKLLNIDYNEKGNYFDQIIYLFHQAFKLNKNKNIVQQSDGLSNVRFHWVDIRDYVLNITNNFIFKYLPDAITDLEDRLSIDNINQFADLINIINSQIVFIYGAIYETELSNDIHKKKHIFSNKGRILANLLTSEYDEITKNFMHKILKSYNNKKIQEKINYIINHELHDIFVNFFEFIKKSLRELEQIKKKLENYDNDNIWKTLMPRKDGTVFYGMEYSELHGYLDLFKTIRKHIFKFVIKNIGPYIMDLFILRRFLDKNYITNTIAYTGAGHSVNLIRLLVKYFDFDITNYSYLKENNIPKAMNIICKTKKKEELYDLFFSPVLSQCSDLGNFPKLFD